MKKNIWYDILAFLFLLSTEVLLTAPHLLRPGYLWLLVIGEFRSSLSCSNMKVVYFFSGRLSEGSVRVPFNADKGTCYARTCRDMLRMLCMSCHVPPPFLILLRCMTLRNSLVLRSVRAIRVSRRSLESSAIPPWRIFPKWRHSRNRPGRLGTRLIKEY